MLTSDENSNQLPGDCGKMASDEKLHEKRQRRTCGEMMKHLFWQGQELNPKQQEALRRLETLRLPWYKRLVVRQRRLVGVCIPIIFFHFFWWGIAIRFNLWHLFVEHYAMSITMIFGSAIAGMTCEGGGAVAFPVMTLVLHIAPETARDFALMIQSSGMSAATFTIFFMRIKCDWPAVGLASVGGVGGIIVGVEAIERHIPPHWKKMIFVSVWFAFAAVLCIMNFVLKRRIVDGVQGWNWWRITVFLVTGFIGGVVTSLVGSGMDICSFSVLTLLFSVSEKIATPSSVVLMAVNSLVGFYWRGVMMQAIDPVSWEYLFVCLPIVVIGAPFASMLGSHFHRIVLAAILVLLDGAAFVSAFIIVKPMTLALGVASGAVTLVSAGGFTLLGYAGYRLRLAALGGVPVAVETSFVEDGEGSTAKKAPSVDGDETPTLTEWTPPGTLLEDVVIVEKEMGKAKCGDGPQQRSGGRNATGTSSYDAPATAHTENPFVDTVRL